jgi:hypothetical protein
LLLLTGLLRLLLYDGPLALWLAAGGIRAAAGALICILRLRLLLLLAAVCPAPLLG